MSNKNIWIWREIVLSGNTGSAPTDAIRDGSRALDVMDVRQAIGPMMMHQATMQTR